METGGGHVQGHRKTTRSKTYQNGHRWAMYRDVEKLKGVKIIMKDTGGSVEANKYE